MGQAELRRRIRLGNGYPRGSGPGSCDNYKRQPPFDRGGRDRRPFRGILDLNVRAPFHSTIPTASLDTTDSTQLIVAKCQLSRVVPPTTGESHPRLQQDGLGDGVLPPPYLTCDPICNLTAITTHIVPVSTPTSLSPNLNYNAVTHDAYLYTPRNDNVVSVYYQNVRGLRTKSKKFFLEIENADYDIIALSETWLTTGHHSEEYFSSRYLVFRCDRDYENIEANVKCQSSISTFHRAAAQSYMSNTPRYSSTIDSPGSKVMLLSWVISISHVSVGYMMKRNPFTCH